MRHVREQRRQQGLQALAPGLIELAHQGRGAQLQQQARDFRAVAETGARQCLHQRRGFRLTVPEPSQIDAHGARVGLSPALHQQAKVPADPCAVLIEFLREREPVACAHGECNALARERLRRQPMDLRVAEHLQAVLEPAQMDIGRPQFAGSLRRQQLRLPEARQGGEERGGLQALIAAAAGELQCLHDEFDFADPARTELHVIGELAPLHLALDESLHLPQALEHAVVEIAAVDERPYRCRVNFRITLRTRHRAGFDVRVPLPVAPMARQVVLERGEARHQRARVPERPQTQINAQHKALGRRRLQQPHQRLTQAREKLLVGNAVRAVGFTVLGKQQHQIDIGGEIQLAAAELAHADDDQGLNLARR